MGCSAAVMLPCKRAARALRGVMTCQVGSSEDDWGPGVACHRGRRGLRSAQIEGVVCNC